MKQYIVDEKTLLNLIARHIELDYLESVGVDNWTYYGECKDEYIQEELSCFLDEPISLERICDEDIDFKDIAKYRIKEFKEVENA